jgi:hypothetical protein
MSPQVFAAATGETVKDTAHAQGDRRDAGRRRGARSFGWTIAKREKNDGARSRNSGL